VLIAGLLLAGSMPSAHHIFTFTRSAHYAFYSYRNEAIHNVLGFFLLKKEEKTSGL